MKLKILVAAAVLAAAPSFALAMCNWGEHREQTASQCADGQVYDAATSTCVNQTTS